MKKFVSKIYGKLNPVIINWVDYYAEMGLIDAYVSNKYKMLKGFNAPIDTYDVKIDLVNGYTVVISVNATITKVKYSSEASKQSTPSVLRVSILGPAVERVRQDNGSVDVYPAKVTVKQIKFVEGNFDIDKIDWVLDIQNLMNEYVLKAPAEVVEVDG